MTEAERAALRTLAAKALVDLDDYDVDEARGALKALARGLLELSCERDAWVAHMNPPPFFQITEEDVWPGEKHIVRPPPKERKKYVRNPRGTYDRNLPRKKVAQ